MTPPPPDRVRLLGLALRATAFVALFMLPLPAGIALAGLLIGGRVGLQLLQRLDGRRRSTRDPQPAASTRLGVERSGRAVAIADATLGAHGLILGATGAGKSTTLVTILEEQIRRGRPVVAIDLKGSPGFAQQLAGAAHAAGRPFACWSLDGPAHWNPLATGNATELKDKLIATERFTEPHYKRAAERYVQLALQVLQEARPERPPSLAAVVEMLDPTRFAATTRSLPAGRRDYLQGYLASLTTDQLSAVRGLGSRLAILTESHTGKYLEPPATGSGAPVVDVRRALAGGEVTLFSLNSSSYGGLAAQLGTLAVQDLVSAAGARLRGPIAGASLQGVIAIDEFSALGSDNVLALLARGREAGVGVLLATQELADLDRAGPGLRQQVLGNTALKVAHRQDVPESALAVSKLAGQFKAWDRSYHQQGGRFSLQPPRVTMREVDRYAVEPEAVRTLRTGEAVVIVKSPESSATIARIERQPPAPARRGERQLPAPTRRSKRQPPAPGVTR